MRAISHAHDYLYGDLVIAIENGVGFSVGDLGTVTVIDQTAVRIYWYSGFTTWFDDEITAFILTSRPTAAPQPLTHNCPTCKRNCDIGVPCWWCGST